MSLGKAIKVKPSWLNQTIEDIRRLEIKLGWLEDRVKKLECKGERKMKKCKACYGYGFWAWGDICPVGPMDAQDGVPTIKCPECGASANPRKNKERYEQIKKLWKEGKLLYGVISDEDYPKLRTELNRKK